MIFIQSRYLSAAALFAFAACGCAKAHPHATPAQVAPAPRPAAISDASTRIAALGRLTDSYADTSNQLPGGSVAEHRQLMARVFSELEEILPLLKGPAGGAQFQQQMQVVRNAQVELASGPRDLPPEPTIDVGLRAARDVLSDIAHSAFYDQAQLTPLFGEFSAKINELDTVRGPMHQLDTGEAVGISSQIIRDMAAGLTQRLTQENPGSRPAQ